MTKSFSLVLNVYWFVENTFFRILHLFLITSGKYSIDSHKYVWAQNFFVKNILSKIRLDGEDPMDGKGSN